MGAPGARAELLGSGSAQCLWGEQDWPHTGPWCRARHVPVEPGATPAGLHPDSSSMAPGRGAACGARGAVGTCVAAQAALCKVAAGHRQLVLQLGGSADGPRLREERRGKSAEARELSAGKGPAQRVGGTEGMSQAEGQGSPQRPPSHRAAERAAGGAAAGGEPRGAAGAGAAVGALPLRPGAVPAGPAPGPAPLPPLLPAGGRRGPAAHRAGGPARGGPRAAPSPAVPGGGNGAGEGRAGGDGEHSQHPPLDSGGHAGGRAGGAGRSPHIPGDGASFGALLQGPVSWGRGRGQQGQPPTMEPHVSPPPQKLSWGVLIKPPRPHRCLCPSLSPPCLQGGAGLLPQGWRSPPAAAPAPSAAVQHRRTSERSKTFRQMGEEL